MTKRIYLLLLGILCALGAIGQTTVTGTVMDEDGNPLVGASVLMKGVEGGVFSGD